MLRPLMSWKKIFLLLVVFIVILACSIMQATPNSTPGFDPTKVVLEIQSTNMALQLTQSAGNTIPTLSQPVATATPYPTYTLVPAEAAVIPVTATPLDIRELIKTSNILIYEDIMGSADLKPIVNDTISLMNFSGGRIVNTGDRLGDFKKQANSATQWDLIIVAAEARSSFSGEMFEMMYDHINNGGAVIIETWYLDKVGNGKIGPILSKCGVGLFRDWERNYNYDPFKYSIYWLDQSHPLLSTPNTVSAPSYPYPEWFTDAGDLLELGAGGDAVLVGGLYPDRKSDYGVLAVCMGGRMVIQTFSSHDYEWNVVQPLWENYITYTLTSHYEYEYSP